MYRLYRVLKDYRKKRQMSWLAANGFAHFIYNIRLLCLLTENISESNNALSMLIVKIIQPESLATCIRYQHIRISRFHDSAVIFSLIFKWLDLLSEKKILLNMIWKEKNANFYKILLNIWFYLRLNSN